MSDIKTDGFPRAGESCIFCGICAKNCPVEAITVERAEKRWSVDTSACVQCGTCAEKCPKSAISMGGEPAAKAQAPKAAPVPKSKGVLVCDESLCTGCMNCMFACTLNKDGVACPDLARIQMNVHTQAEFHIAAQPCQQCADPKCLFACPVEAIKVDPVTGARCIDQDVCVGCGSCVEACPYEIPRVRFDKVKGKATKCDLCGGDPECVKMCPTGALRYVTDPEGMDTGYDAPKGGN